MLEALKFQYAVAGDPFDKAMKRAAEAKPIVIHLHTDLLDRESWYLVKRTDKISKYVNRIWQDPDGRIFIECACHNGLPPLDSKTRLPAFEPTPCTHAASVLLFIGEKEDEK